MTKACILSVAGIELTAGEAALFRSAAPWGVILMGRSCQSRMQVRQLVADIWDAIGRQCLIFIDQEGGRVARLKAPEWPVFPSAATYAEIFAVDPERGLEATWLGHRLMAEELSSLSIHADCAPVLDVPVPGASDVIGDRAFGTDAVSAAELARAALDGLRAGGVVGVIKHMPGHGRSMADSHVELPRVVAGQSELATDFDAFTRLQDAPMAMTAHISYDTYDAGVPATLSKTMIQTVIRERIGFDGLLMTDDLGMNALGGSLSERGTRAIAAGCDVLLHCSGFLKDPQAILAEMTEVADIAPVLAGKSAARAGIAENFASESEPIELAPAWARFKTLLSDQGVIA